MTEDLSEALRAHVSGRGTRAPGLSDLRSRRVRSSVRNRRVLRAAAATSGALVAVGGIAFGVAYAADHGFLGSTPGSSPSATPTGVPTPSVTVLPSSTDSLVPITWPEQEPSWVVDLLGSQTEPIECGVRLSDLPTGAVTIDEARRATRDEVAAVIEEVLANTAQVPGGITDADRLVLSDDMYLAAWTVDDAALTNSPSTGAVVIHTGLEVGFGPWEGKMAEWNGRQLWGGYAVVEDGVVVARGHHADTSVGAGVINTLNLLIAEEDWLGTISPQLTLITRPWQGVEWCPGVTPGQEGRSLVAVAAATAPDRSPTYAWAELPPD